MLILALETATRAGSLAIVGPGRQHAVVGDVAPSHGARLPRELFDFLASQRLALSDIERLVVVSGPGSFTGLRIGLATMQGIAMTTGVTVVAIPTLEAMAEAWRHDHPGRTARLVTLLDGARGDVFFAVFDCHDQAPAVTIVEASVATPLDAGRRIAALPGSLAQVVVGDGATRYHDVLAPVLGMADFERDLPNLALGAAILAQKGGPEPVSPHALRPLYVRRPDAVLARERAAAAAEPVLTITRASSPEDLASIAELQRRSFANAWGVEALQWEISNSIVARMYAARAADGAMVAYCAGQLVFDELHVNSVAVEERARRRGVARRLLKYVLGEAAAEGARSATLEVRQSNVAGRRLYESLGFKVEAVRRNYYQDPREDALILWHRDLAGNFPRQDR